MKKYLQIGILISLLAVFIFSGCSLLFFKDKDNLSSWHSELTEGAVFNYYVILYKDGNTIDTKTYTMTVEDVLEENGLIINRIYGSDYGYTYLIYDNENGMAAFTADINDKVIDRTTDNIILETPVEVGNTWISTNEWNSEILSIDTHQDVDAGVYSDIIEVESITQNSEGDIYEWAYMSQSLGLMIVFRRTDWIENGNNYSQHEELVSVE